MDINSLTHASVLALHIGAAALGLLAGLTAISLRKGARWHRRAGRVFSVAMLSMGASAVYLALAKAQILNALVGVLTCYLVATAWLAGRPRGLERRDAERTALVFAALTGVAFVGCGIAAANGALELTGDESAGGYFFFGLVALLAAALDARLLLRGISARHRTARHVWRMTFPLAIAVISVGPRLYKFFPHLSKSMVVQLGPVTLVLVAMMYWLWRVLRGNYRSRTRFPTLS